MLKSQDELTLLNQFLTEHNLNRQSKLYRYTGMHYIKEKNGVPYLIAKDECSDIAIDYYYDKGHVFVTQEFGMGLSFLSNQEVEYERDDRVCVHIILEDVFRQGGLIYEITSLPAYLKGYFITLPTGKIKVTIIDE